MNEWQKPYLHFGKLTGLKIRTGLYQPVLSCSLCVRNFRRLAAYRLTVAMLSPYHLVHSGLGSKLGSILGLRGPRGANRP